MARARWFGLVLAVATALSLGAFAPASFAQAASLTGESLESSTVFGSGHQTTFNNFTCDKDGTTTVSFQTTGVALGPYTGTFTETGTFTIGPQTDTTIDSRGVGGILAFQATFTILSDFPQGTVTGTKTLAPGAPTQPTLAGGFGRCDADGSSPPNDVFAIVTNPFVVYEAQINATTGSRTDSGTGSVLIHSMPILPAVLSFQEVFNSTEPAPDPEPCVDVHDHGSGQGTGHDEHGNGLGKGHLNHCLEP
jgi:hypothetical protein